MVAGASSDKDKRWQGKVVAAFGRLELPAAGRDVDAQANGVSTLLPEEGVGRQEAAAEVEFAAGGGDVVDGDGVGGCWRGQMLIYRRTVIILLLVPLGHENGSWIEVEAKEWMVHRYTGDLACRILLFVGEEELVVNGR